MANRFHLGFVSFSLHNQIKIFTSIHFMLTSRYVHAESVQLSTKQQLECRKTRWNENLLRDYRNGYLNASDNAVDGPLCAVHFLNDN